MINKSLENLGMGYVDLYIYHMWDYQTPLYDIMEGLTDIVKEGKARYIGISNCFAWQLAEKRDVTMTEDEIHYLEEPYVPHALAGVMAQNKPDSAKEKHVWSTGNQKI